ncbi:MAG: DoxX family protein [Gemmatimonadota bacterium]|nr:DoxX family protein [Gemmatimonadota bacterium]
MNRAVWSVQLLLAVLFLGAGGTKILTPTPELAARFTWVVYVPSWSPKVIGVLELAGAVGLVAPAATGIIPALTPAAAAGLALTMAVAGLLHIRLGEYSQAVVPLVLLALCFFVAHGRLRSDALGRMAAHERDPSEPADNA